MPIAQHVQQLVQQFASQHALVYGALCLVGGHFLPKVLSFAETQGVDEAVAGVRAAMQKAGLTEEQIKAVEGHLAAAADRAAEDLKKDAQ